MADIDPTAMGCNKSGIRSADTLDNLWDISDDTMDNLPSGNHGLAVFNPLL